MDAEKRAQGQLGRSWERRWRMGTPLSLLGCCLGTRWRLYLIGCASLHPGLSGDLAIQILPRINRLQFEAIKWYSSLVITCIRMSDHHFFFCHVFASPRPPSQRKYSSGVTRMHDLGEQMGLILKCAVKAAYVRRHVDICTSRCF